MRLIVVWLVVMTGLSIGCGSSDDSGLYDDGLFVARPDAGQSNDEPDPEPDAGPGGETSHPGTGGGPSASGGSPSGLGGLGGIGGIGVGGLGP